MEMGISTQPYICFQRRAVSVYFLSLSPLLYDVLYSSSPMQCVWRRGYPHSLTSVSRGGQFLYIFSHFLLCYVMFYILVHLCNVYGDGDIHTALHLFPEEGSFCIFSLTFSSDNREILGG